MLFCAPLDNRKLATLPTCEEPLLVIYVRKADIAPDDSCGAHPKPGQVQEAKEGVGEAVEGPGVRVVGVHREDVKNFP